MCIFVGTPDLILHISQEHQCNWNVVRRCEQRRHITPQDFSAPLDPFRDSCRSNSDIYEEETLVATHSVPLRRCSDSHSEAHDMCGSQAQLQKNELSRVLMCIFVDTADVAPTVIPA